MRRPEQLLWLTVVAGCSFGPRAAGDDTVIDGPEGPIDGKIDAFIPDARIDAPPTDPCSDWTFTPTEADPCDVPDPNVTHLSLTAGDWVIDSDSGQVTGPATINLPWVELNDVGIVSVDHLSIPTGATLRAIGDLPLAIFVWHSATIAGVIDVSSNENDGFGGQHGAGADANCPSTSSANAPGIGGDQSGGDGGSGGGGFQGAGGNGGDGNGGSGSGDGGDGGNARALPLVLEGGCPGARAESGMSGVAGRGGGGIALLVKEDLTIDGVIHAGGRGGGGALGGGQEAGAGGGSGGMIKLMARRLFINAPAILAANGGQGGGGNDNNDADPGEDGQPDETEANVDNKEGMGTRGGGGGYLGRLDGGSASDSSRGAGGGGGGVGYIVYHGAIMETVSGSATMSPPGMSF